MHSKRFLTRLFALFLAVVMIVLLIPAAAFAEGESSGSIQFTTSTLGTSNEDGQPLTIESIFTRQDTQETTVMPCDIIFVVDQSKWMNTDTDKGATRSAIIAAMQNLLGGLSEPTYSEHRVAVAGYGRLNMSAGTDPYDSSIYPGTRASGDNISLNTGYYTKDGFVSQNGWNDVPQDNMSSDQLPTMSESYKSAMTYDRAFMTLDDAKSVLTEDKMMAWYAGATRLDAGLSIAEQLASVATEYAQTNTEGDRNLIVCILATSLPIQNTAHSDQSTIRTAAVESAAKLLKEEGATVLAFGDYHSSGKTISGAVQDTEENFNTIMKEVCTDAKDFYSLSAYSSVSAAMNGLITNIETTAGQHEEGYTIDVDKFSETTQEGEINEVAWSDLLAGYGDLKQKVIDATTATVELYVDTGMGEDGTPIFDGKPVRTLEIPLDELLTEDGISYTVVLSQFYKTEEDEEADVQSHDYRVVIDLTLPVLVTSTYQVQHYYEQLNGDYLLDDTKTENGSFTGLVGETFPVTATQQSKEHYHLNQDQSTLTGTVTVEKAAEPLILSLYYDLDTVTVSYDLKYEGADSTDYPTETVKYGSTVTVKDSPTRQDYDFTGWTMGESSYSSGDTLTVTENITLVAQWQINIAPYLVEHYRENLDGTYTLLETEEPQTGKIGSTVTATPKALEGDLEHYHVNEDASTLSGQVYLQESEEAAPLTLKVYYDLDTVTVSYDLNGGDAGDTDYSEETMKYGSTVTVKAEPTRTGYIFAGWSDGVESYEAEDQLTVIEDILFTAQWQPLPTPTGVESEQTPWVVFFLLALAAAVAFVLCKIHKKFHK
jgi:uncharacterized repeat protein (TIGR02543 family)